MGRACQLWLTNGNYDLKKRAENQMTMDVVAEKV